MDAHASTSRLNRVDTNFQAVQNNHEVASPEYRTDGEGDVVVAKSGASPPADSVHFTGTVPPPAKDFHHSCPSCGRRVLSGGGTEADKLQAMEKFAGDTQAIIKKKRMPADEKLRQVLELLAKLMGELTQEKDKAPVAVKDEQEVGTDMALAPPGHEQMQAPKSDKKRKRHKFTGDQLSQLEELGQRVNWVLGNVPKEEQEQFATRLGIKVDSLRYWFHNTKQKQKQKKQLVVATTEQ